MWVQPEPENSFVSQRTRRAGHGSRKYIVKLVKWSDKSALQEDLRHGAAVGRTGRPICGQISQMLAKNERRNDT